MPKNQTFLNNKNKIIRWPKKNSDKFQVLIFLHTKFELNKIYNEKEINFIINQNISFNGDALIRRSLIDQGFLARERDGSKYWKLEINDTIKDYKVNG